MLIKGESFACSVCGSDQIHVVETRFNPGEQYIRRRRGCRSCNHRFTTIEISVEELEKREAAVFQAIESIAAATNDLISLSPLSRRMLSHCRIQEKAFGVLGGEA